MIIIPAGQHWRSRYCRG